MTDSVQALTTGRATPANLADFGDDARPLRFLQPLPADATAGPEQPA